MYVCVLCHIQQGEISGLSVSQPMTTERSLRPSLGPKSSLSMDMATVPIPGASITLPMLALAQALLEATGPPGAGPAEAQIF